MSQRVTQSDSQRNICMNIVARYACVPTPSSPLLYAVVKFFQLQRLRHAVGKETR